MARRETVATETSVKLSATSATDVGGTVGTDLFPAAQHSSHF